MMSRKSFADLPETIFFNIFEYLNWYEVGRFDNALLDINARNSYLVALKLRKVKVERNRFWWELVDKGILSWLISRDIQVISWDSEVDDTKLMIIANGLPQLQSLNIGGSDKITDAGIRAVANGLPQLQSLNIVGCGKITNEGIETVRRINGDRLL
jgi:hypothetical protein